MELEVGGLQVSNAKIRAVLALYAYINEAHWSSCLHSQAMFYAILSAILVDMSPRNRCCFEPARTLIRFMGDLVTISFSFCALRWITQLSDPKNI